MLKKGDILLILFVGLAVCVSLLWRHHEPPSKPGVSRTAVITRDGRIVDRINLDQLSEPRFLAIEKGIVILAEEGRIRFLESGCPDKNCVKTGWLARKGEKAVCLPLRTTISIEGDGPVDSVSY